jgi:hypothetical protein
MVPQAEEEQRAKQEAERKKREAEEQERKRQEEARKKVRGLTRRHLAPRAREAWRLGKRWQCGSCGCESCVAVHRFAHKVLEK